MFQKLYTFPYDQKAVQSESTKLNFSFKIRPFFCCLCGWVLHTEIQVSTTDVHILYISMDEKQQRMYVT